MYPFIQIINIASEDECRMKCALADFLLNPPCEFYVHEESLEICHLGTIDHSQLVHVGTQVQGSTFNIKTCEKAKKLETLYL